MIRKMIMYKVKKEKLEEVKKAITEFINAVKTKEPKTLMYESYYCKDKVSFVHFMLFEDEKAEEIHRSTEHVSKFVEVLFPSCEKEPVFTDLNLFQSAGRAEI